MDWNLITVSHYLFVPKFLSFWLISFVELAVYNKTIYFCFSMQVCFFFSVIGPAAFKFLEK